MSASPAPAKKIVCLAPFVSEILAHLGVVVENVTTIRDILSRKRPRLRTPPNRSIGSPWR